MGRNSVPRLDWDGGILHRFRATGSDNYPKPDDGRQVVYEREATDGRREVLCCFYADGFYECVASAFASGFWKGMTAGEIKARQEIRDALGIPSHPEDKPHE